MAAPADIVAAPSPHASPFNVVIQTPEMRPMAYSELLPEMAALLDDASASLYIDDADDKLRESSTTTTNPYSALIPVSYTHLRAHETPEHLVCRLLLEKKKQIHNNKINHV
eukprot:TRINITY_DN18527_c0_g1_i1.p1 TRINITY_DN18527_c0_g1~~TRINITY_DN18527_c0_g1_i1.p1  ORF type:complete len:111 (+),score=32.75 TRINITY_DN18527_c0_g1_i1:232-564(+)